MVDGAVICVDSMSNVTANSSVFKNNAAERGGAISGDDYVHLHLFNSVFTNNMISVG